MNWVFAGLGVALLAGLLWIRIAPQDPGRWHVLPERAETRDFTGGAMRVVDGDAARLARLDAIIRATPRTRVLAGSTKSGRITYVTRSRVFGFPDYTTVEARDGRIVLYGRLRFGKSDMGVNAARLDGWLARLGPGGE